MPGPPAAGRPRHQPRERRPRRRARARSGAAGSVGRCVECDAGCRAPTPTRPSSPALRRGGRPPASTSSASSGAAAPAPTSPPSTARPLARAVAGLAVPVLTGIGHEIDTSVADEVAWQRHVTPTACAGVLVDRVRRWCERRDEVLGRCLRAAAAATDRAGDRLDRPPVGSAGSAPAPPATPVAPARRPAGRAGRARPVAALDAAAAALDQRAGRAAAADPARLLARGWSITRTADGSARPIRRRCPCRRRSSSPRWPTATCGLESRRSAASDLPTSERQRAGRDGAGAQPGDTHRERARRRTAYAAMLGRARGDPGRARGRRRRRRRPRRQGRPGRRARRGLPRPHRPARMEVERVVATSIDAPDDRRPDRHASSGERRTGGSCVKRPCVGCCRRRGGGREASPSPSASVRLGRRRPRSARRHPHRGRGRLRRPLPRRAAACPSRVTISADRLGAGLDRGRRSGDQTGHLDASPVEVPGGGDKDFVVVVPTPPTFERPRGRRAPRSAPASRSPAERRARTAGRRRSSSASCPTSPRPTCPRPSTLPDGHRHRPLRRPRRRHRSRVAGALDPLGTIVAGPDELGRLDADARAGVLDWVDRGGRLVIDAAAGTDVAGLPDEWQPGDAAAERPPASARSASSAAPRRPAAGPTSSSPRRRRRWPTSTSSAGSASPSSRPSATPSPATPASTPLELPWLLGFLAAYVALVGPVAWFVLRRRRAGARLGRRARPRRVFTGGSLRRRLRPPHGTTAPPTARARDGPGRHPGHDRRRARSRAPARDGAGQLPRRAGPPAASTTRFFGGQLAGGQRPRRAHQRRRRPRPRSPSPPAASASCGARARSTLDGGLVVEARSEGDAVVGTVRNDLPFAVERGRRASSGATPSRSAASRPARPPSSASRAASSTSGDPFSPPEAALWPAEAGYGAAAPTSTPSSTWRSGTRPPRPRTQRPCPGIVTVVGLDPRSYASPVDVAGEGDPTGRSAIVGRARSSSGDGTVAPGAPTASWCGRPSGGRAARRRRRHAGRAAAIWRFALPGRRPTGGRSSSTSPVYVGRVDVWDGTRVGRRSTTGSSDRPTRSTATSARSATSTCPPAPVADGVVWVRGWILQRLRRLRRRRPRTCSAAGGGA